MTVDIRAIVEEALSDADFGKNDGGFDNGRPERNVERFVDALRDRGYVIVREGMYVDVDY